MQVINGHHPIIVSGNADSVFHFQLLVLVRRCENSCPVRTFHDAVFPTFNLHAMHVLHVYPHKLNSPWTKMLVGLKITFQTRTLSENNTFRCLFLCLYYKKLFHKLCYCTARKVLLILVNIGIKIPYYPAFLSRGRKLSSDNAN